MALATVQVSRLGHEGLSSMTDSIVLGYRQSLSRRHTGGGHRRYGLSSTLVEKAKPILTDSQTYKAIGDPGSPQPHG